MLRRGCWTGVKRVSGAVRVSAVFIPLLFVGILSAAGREMEETSARRAK
jgi:hypothetical protein